METPPPKSEAKTVTPATPPGSANAGKPAAAPAESTITTDGSPIESRLLVYHAIKRAAKEIGEDIANARIARVAIHDQADILAVGAYRALLTQLDVLLTEVRGEVQRARDLLDGAGGAFESFTLAGVTGAIAGLTGAFSGVSALLQSVVGVVALFRETVTVKSHDVTVADSALVSAVCGQLVYQKITVFVPAVVPPGFASADSALASDLAKLADARVDLDAVHKEAADLETRLTAEIAEIDKQLAAAPNDPTLTEQRSTRQQRLSIVTAVKQRLTTVAAHVDAFRAALVKVDESSGVTPLSRILRAEKVAAVLHDTHLLALKVTGGGGALETRDSSIVTSGKRYYSGGAIVDFMLFAPQGQIVLAGVLPVYTGLVKVVEGRKERDLTDVETL